MIDKRRLIVNASSSVAQIIVTGITLFVLYRYLLEVIGVEKLGIWALVLATSSMTQLANMGFSGSIVKHVAKYNALNNIKKLILTIQTAALSIAFFSSIIILGLYPLAEYYFSLVLELNNLDAALEILPLALLSLWVLMITSIYQGALYGYQLIDQRNFILMLDTVSHFVLCILLTPDYGLLGLAYARLIQNIITLVITVIILKRHIPGLPIIPYQWSLKLFKEMLGYATNFQIITLLVMLADPVTKGFLSKYGSVSMVGYYEMANKLVQLFRSLIVSANQVLVPSFASLKELEPHKISNVYSKSHQTVAFLTIPGFSLLAVSAPLISNLWIGEFESTFVISMCLLCAGWMFNTLAVPAYFSGVGTGDMKVNVVSHLLMTVLNILLIIMVGVLWNGVGVIISWAVSLAIGGLSLNLMYFRKNKIALSELIPTGSRLLVLLCFVGLGLSYYMSMQRMELVNMFFIKSIESEFIMSLFFDGMIVLLFLLVISYAVIKHPVLKSIKSWVVKS